MGCPGEKRRVRASGIGDERPTERPQLFFESGPLLFEIGCSGHSDIL